MGQFAFVNDADLKIAPGTRIVKAGEYSAYIRAGAILDEARRKALEILAEAGRKADDLRQAGFVDGHRLGKETSTRYMLGVVNKSREHLQDSEERVVALVIAVVRKILGDMDEREVVVRMVRTAMAVVSRQNQVTVMVAPDKVDAVKASLDRILQPYPRITSVEVVGDAKVAGGDCVLETKVGRVEASLETQLRTITAAMSDVAPGRKERLENDLKAIELELSSGLTLG